MRLLIVTQAVNTEDPILGFFVRWIEEFAKRVERVEVICLTEGKHTLPGNVRVHSLGKERYVSRLKYVFNFYTYIWRLRHEYDSVFVHMNSEYAVLGGWLWRLWGKQTGLWYVHRANTCILRTAEKFVQKIFTSTKEGLTLKTDKAVYLGHGIDITEATRPSAYPQPRDRCALLCVGRLAPIKDQKTVITACGILSRAHVPFTLTCIGGANTSSDKKYEEELRQLVQQEHLEDKVFFQGQMPHEVLIPHFWRANVHINACPTGGLDKVVIEGMAGGALPVVANEAFRSVLGGYADRLLFRHGDAEALADCLRRLLETKEQETIRAALERRAREHFSLTNLITRILSQYETSQ